MPNRFTEVKLIRCLFRKSNAGSRKRTISTTKASIPRSLAAAKMSFVSDTQRDAILKPLSGCDVLTVSSTIFQILFNITHLSISAWTWRGRTLDTLGQEGHRQTCCLNSSQVRHAQQKYRPDKHQEEVFSR
jgi:hypothetical protein